MALGQVFNIYIYKYIFIFESQNLTIGVPREIASHTGLGRDSPAGRAVIFHVCSTALQRTADLTGETARFHTNWRWLPRRAASCRRGRENKELIEATLYGMLYCFANGIKGFQLFLFLSDLAQVSLFIILVRAATKPFAKCHYNTAIISH